MATPTLSRYLFWLLFLVIPCLWWMVVAPASDIWAPNWYAQATFWGRLTAIAGLGLFAGNLLLSSRLAFLDRWFGGLDQLYVLHRATGKQVWFLLAVHASLIGLRWASYGWDTVANVWFTLPAASIELFIGRSAFLLLTILVAITIYWRLKYETKKLLHYWLVLVVVLGAIHALLISDTLLPNPVFALYILSLLGISTGAFAVRTILGGWPSTITKLRVSDVVPLSHSITRIDLTPRKNSAFPKQWLPGQFAFLRVKTNQCRYDEHPFSVISAPADGKISFAVRAVGDFTSWLPQLAVGTEAQIEGPYGGFSYTLHGNPYQVWIAGGIGITPFLAMANHLADSHDHSRSIQLVYSVNSIEDAVFASRLRDIAQINPSFSLVLWDASVKGHLTADWFTPEQLRSADFLICGPRAMMSDITKQLSKQKVPASRIHTERFQLF